MGKGIFEKGPDFSYQIATNYRKKMDFIFVTFIFLGTWVCTFLAGGEILWKKDACEDFVFESWPMGIMMESPFTDKFPRTESLWKRNTLLVGAPTTIKFLGFMCEGWENSPLQLTLRSLCQSPKLPIHPAIVTFTADYLPIRLSLRACSLWCNIFIQRLNLPKPDPIHPQGRFSGPTTIFDSQSQK